MNMIKQNSSDTKPIVNVAAIVAASFISINSLSYAAEQTLKAGEFQQVLTLEAVAVPTEYTEVSIDPKAWSGFKIEKVLPQGTQVAKGDTLIWVDAESLDEAIEKTTKARVLEKLQLEEAQQGLAELEKKTPTRLESAQRKFDHYSEDYAFYKKTTRPDIIDGAKYSVKRSKDSLSYIKEELKQLKMMYAEDGLTEETEEIILQRAKNSVANGERNLKEVEIKAKFTIDVNIPRKDIEWKKGFDKEQDALESTKKTLERNLKIKREEVAKLVADDAKKQEDLDELIEDRKLINIVAPADGVVHYGNFDLGKWQAEKASKVLVKGGSVPAKMTLMSIVPVDVQYQFNAFLKESEKDLFSEDKPAYLKLKKNPWVSFEVVAEAAPSYPNLQHKWLVGFTANDALSAGVVTGTKATVSVITASGDDVISVPVKAVTAEADGSFSVMLKMAEGEPKKTPVEVGRQSGDEVEITGGVEAGQVIITPES